MKLRNPWNIGRDGTQKAEDEAVKKIVAKHPELTPVIRPPIHEAIVKHYFACMNGEPGYPVTRRHKNVQVTVRGHNEIEVVTFVKIA